MGPYERLDAWQVAHQMALQIYAATDSWPTEERFGLTIQLRRAVLSVPTNIAEGTAKRGTREFRRFLDIALGSLSEVTYLLRFCRDRGLLTSSAWVELESIRNRAGQLTWQLYRSISTSSRAPRSSS
ncbi:MAG TPA: four helix bundle protein, partial [Gemmatimonadales bacterium]|jgi:four helix bundle protein